MLVLSLCEHCYKLLYVSYISGDPDPSSSNPFDLLGAEGSSGGANPLFSNLLAFPYPSIRNTFLV
jgi:hypothetical protein